MNNTTEIAKAIAGQLEARGLLAIVDKFRGSLRV